MMKFKLLWIVLVLCPVITHAEIYQWRDKSGIINFSDQPQPGAVPTQLSPAALQEIPTVATQQAASLPVNRAYEPTLVPASYTILSIETPADQATVHDNTGTLLITPKLEPALMTGDTLQVLLDGKPYGAAQTSLPLKITGVERGAHQLAIAIQNQQGKVLKTSAQITLYLHKTIVKSSSRA